MNCKNYNDHLKAYVDGELRGLLRLRVSRHVHACEACQAECHEMKQLSQRLQAIEMPPMPEGLRERILQTVETKYQPEITSQRQAWRWAYAVPLVLMISALYAVYKFNAIPGTEMQKSPPTSSTRVAQQPAEADALYNVPAPLRESKKVSSGAFASNPPASSEMSETSQEAATEPNASDRPIPSAVDQDKAPLRQQPKQAPAGRTRSNATLPKSALAEPVQEISLQLEVQDLNKALHSTLTAAESHQAVLKATAYETNGHAASYVEIELQIPQEKLEGFKAKLQKTGKVTSEKVLYAAGTESPPAQNLGIKPEAGTLAPPPGMDSNTGDNSVQGGGQETFTGSRSAQPQTPAADKAAEEKTRLQMHAPQGNASPKQEERETHLKRTVAMPVVKIRLILQQTK